MPQRRVNGYMFWKNECAEILFPEQAAQQRVVNVASVPQRSPFRYPGGKTWLVPRIREWLASLPARPNELIEPFAGGGIIGLTAAFERRAAHVTLVEKDEQVAAVWQAMIAQGNAERLAERIERFKFSPEHVKDVLAKQGDSLVERAFQTILRNRVNRGGIMAKGAGMLKQGENGKGMASRWYPRTLAQRIRAIHQVRDRLAFICGDGLDIIARFAGRADAAFFIDPPYTAGSGKRAGRRLYAHSELDHAALFSLMNTAQGAFLMTYDDAPEIRDMARQHGFAATAVAMKNTHHAQMTELVISRDLSWL